MKCGVVISNSYPSACNWQLPLFSHPGQKWLPSTNSICNIARRIAFSSGVSTTSSCPVDAMIVHAETVRPLTITVQSLQLPCGVNSG